MNNALEALKSIKRTIEQLDYGFVSKEDSEDFILIETALKEYESMKRTNFIVANKKISNDDLEKLKNQRMFIGCLEQCEIKSLFDEGIREKLKALALIKKVDENNLRHFINTYIKDENERKLVKGVLL